MVTDAGTREGTCYSGGMSKTVSSGAGAVGVSDLPALQFEALLESPLDSDDEGLTCVDCGEPTLDECEDCGDPLCCDDLCSYCAL